MHLNFYRENILLSSLINYFMTACSFLPAATQMIYDMNLQHLLKGITFECPPVALAEKNKVVRCVLEGKSYSEYRNR